MRERPWYRKATGWWYVQIGRKQHRLARDEAGAHAEWHRLMERLRAGEAPRAEGAPTVRDLFNRFLVALKTAVARGERDESTYRDYGRFLAPAAAAFGGLAATDAKPLHVLAWLDGRPGWGPTTRNKAIGSVKAAFRWGRKAGHLSADPMADLDRPAARRREAVPTATDLAASWQCVPDRAFGDLFHALVETGARPGELFGLTAAGVDLAAGTWRVRNKTRSTTGERTRLIYLTPTLVALSRELVARHTDGPIFRNRIGKAWNRNSVGHRFQRIRAMTGIGPGLTAYALRHVYITDALERGVEIATVATLVGHTDTAMIMRIYSKLSGRTAHLREAARRARGGA
jgi:integrase